MMAEMVNQDPQLNIAHIVKKKTQNTPAMTATKA